MFALISRLVTRRAGVVVLTCVALAAALRAVAPAWDQVTKDDNVRFFPPDFPSVIGQSLLERGFPRDASSSQVVLVCERKGGPLTPQDLGYVDAMAGRFYQFAQEHLTLGFNGFALRLMSPVSGVRDIPTEGKNLVVVAALENVLYFRIFDGDGKIVVDTDETKLAAQSGAIAYLKKQLEDLWPPHELTEGEKDRVINSVTSIVGHTFFKKLDTYRSPVIGPRLMGASVDGHARAVLTIVALNGTYLAKTTRVAVDRIMEWVAEERTRLPAGLDLAVTGSAVVGHDTNTAAEREHHQHDLDAPSSWSSSSCWSSTGRRSWRWCHWSRSRSRCWSRSGRSRS